jgi:hypothetical protein
MRKELRMSIIKKIRRSPRRASAKTTDNTKVTRRVYASLRENIQSAIAETMKSHRSLISASFKSRASAKDWLDLVVGDAVTDTAEEVYEDLPDIAEVMVDETEPEAETDEDMPMATDDEDADDMPADMPVAEEEETEEPETEEPEAGDELEQVASELEDIKGRALAQAKRLAKAGDVDNAARLKVIISRL